MARKNVSKTRGSRPIQQARLALWPALVLALGTFLAYANSLHGEFVFDDHDSIPRNPSIRRLYDLPAIAATIPGGATVTGRPVLNFTFALNYAFAKERVFDYHLTNVVIHVLAALALFGVARRSLLSLDSLARASHRADALALAIALLWAVHPLCTESVTYVAQRAESLGGLFYLSSLYALIRGARAAESGRSAGAWYALSVFSCLLGMGTKEVLVSAPIILLLHDRAFLSATWREAMNRRKWFYAALFATWGWLAYLVSAAGGRGGTAGFGAGVTSWAYFQTQWVAIVQYLRLAIWPDRLVFEYGRGLESPRAAVYACGLFLASLAAATLWLWWRAPRIGWLGVTFFATLAPSSSVLPVVTQTKAEHRMYLPLAVVVTCLVLACDALWTWLAPRPLVKWRWMTVGVLGLTVMALGARTWARNADYRTEIELWKRTASDHPSNPNALLGLATAHYQRDDLAACVAVVDKAIARFPDNPEAYALRGRALRDLGQMDRALNDLARALELSPRLAEAYTVRGELHHRAGDTQKSVEDYTRAIELRAQAPTEHYNRGNALMDMQRFDEAIADYDAAITLRPDFAAAHHNRAMAYQRKGDAKRALAEFTRTIEVDPSFAAAYSGRGGVWLGLGEPSRAIPDFTRAIELSPNDAGAYNERGNAFGMLGRPDLAILDHTRVIAIAPDFAPAYLNRALSHYAQGDFESAWRDVEACQNRGGAPDPQFLRQLSLASGRETERAN